MLTLLSMFCINFGISMVIPNAISLALKDYQQVVGTSSSIFGFFYYVLISAFTLGMGMLHNDTLYPMPIYFWGIAVVMGILYQLKLKNDNL